MLGRFEVAHSASLLVSRDASPARGSTNNPRTEPYLTLVTMVSLDSFRDVLPPGDPVRDHHRPTLVVATDLSRRGRARGAEDQGEGRATKGRRACGDGRRPPPVPEGEARHGRAPSRPRRSPRPGRRRSPPPGRHERVG